LVQIASGALERFLNGSLNCKVHREPKKFHLLRKNIWEIVRENRIDIKGRGAIRPVTCDPRMEGAPVWAHP
jgi:hypothetical protein